MTFALVLLARAVAMVVVAPRPSPLRDLRGQPGVTVLADAELRDPSRPQHTCGPPWALGQPAGRPVAVLVDDAELVAEPVAGALAEHWRHGRGSTGPFLLAGLTEDLLLQYRGFAVDLRREGHGLLLAPRRTTDGDLLGVRLPRARSGPSPPGRGLLVQHGRLLPVQIAGPDDSSPPGGHPPPT